MGGEGARLLGVRGGERDVRYSGIFFSLFFIFSLAAEVTATI